MEVRRPGALERIQLAYIQRSAVDHSAIQADQGIGSCCRLRELHNNTFLFVKHRYVHNIPVVVKEPHQSRTRCLHEKVTDKKRATVRRHCWF